MTKKLTFKDFTLSKDTLECIERKGFDTPSEIQEKVIPLLLKENEDIIALAQTGTGKTAAFGLPLVEKITTGNTIPQAIILAPTRELALQVTKELNSYSSQKKLKIATIYGGASIEMQSRELKSGVDIVVGTPGRVIDMLKRKRLKLTNVEYFILDEADEMLKMGFIEDIEEILRTTPEEKRVCLFSATMPKAIKELSKKYMRNQRIVEVKKNTALHTEKIVQSFYKVNRDSKNKLIGNLILKEDFFYGIIFCKTKHEVDALTRELQGAGFDADCIHGDIAQRKREKILQLFRDQKITILVATDVAARGIDVSDLTHVLNHSLPQSIDSYVHRIGRTGRAGKMGHAISFLSPSEIKRLQILERETGFKLKKENTPNEIPELPRRERKQQFSEGRGERKSFERGSGKKSFRPHRDERKRREGRGRREERTPRDSEERGERKSFDSKKKFRPRDERRTEKKSEFQKSREMSSSRDKKRSFNKGPKKTFTRGSYKSRE